MKLIVVRHGETDRNINDDHPVTGPIHLNNTGRKQARAVAETLSSEQINVIYSSDLERAKETAKIIAELHPKTPLYFIAEIRERDSGIYTTRPYTEHKNARLASGLSFRDWKPSGGESFHEVKKRAANWFEKLRQQHSNDCVLIVSHGIFLYAVLEVAVEDGAEVERDDYRHKNGAITVLEVPLAGPSMVKKLNDTTHLEKLTA